MDQPLLPLAAFDEIMATAVKRQHEPQRIVGDLLNAEINEKQARSIKYQLTIAELPLTKDIADFQFDGTPIVALVSSELAEVAETGRARRSIFEVLCQSDASRWVPLQVFCTRRAKQGKQRLYPVSDPTQCGPGGLRWL